MKVNDKAADQIINGFITTGILKSLGDAVSIQDTDFKILYQNQAQIDLNGHHVGEYCYKAYPNKDGVCEGCPLAISLKDGKVHKAEITTNDEKLTVEITSSALKDSAGKIVAGIEVIRDITKRKKTEEALKHYSDNLEDMVKARTLELAEANKQLTQEIAEHKTTDHTLKESEERYKRIANAVTDYTYTVRVEDGKPVETTHCVACSVVTGYTLEDFSADPYLWIKMVIDEDHDLVRRQAGEILSGEFPPSVEHRIIRKDGVVRWVESNLLPNHDMQGNLFSYDGIVQDITGRKQAEERLKESKEKYRLLFDTFSDPVCLYDLNGNILLMNNAGAAGLGRKPKELIGLSLYSFFPDISGVIAERIQQILESSKGIESEDMVILPPNHKRWFKSNHQPVRDKNGKIYAVQTISYDITEKKRAENILRDIAEKISIETGENYFHSLTKFISKELGNEYTLIGELDYTGYKIKTVSVFAKGEIIDNMEYNLVNTPCENVVGKAACFYPDNVQALFPEDKLLVDMGVNSYAGIPLFASDGQPIGIIVTLGSVPIDEGDSERTISLLQIFSARASSELERINAERALRNSEEKYRGLYNDALDMIHIVDKNGKIIDANEIELATMGYTKEEYTGKDLLDIIARDYRQYSKQALEQVLNGNKIAAFETVFVTSKGKQIIVEVNAVPEIIDGEVVSVRAIIRNITERKRVEKELSESKNRFRRLSEATFEGILIHDKGKIIDANHAFSEMFGYEHAEISGMNAFQLIAPDLREQVLEIVQSEYEHPYETVGVKKDGTSFPFEIQAKMLQLEGMKIRVAVCRDITERKKAEKTLRFLSLVTEQISDAVITTNLAYEITYANQAFQHLYGYSVEEILGRSPEILNVESTSEKIQNDIYQAVSSGGIWRGELLNRKKDGSTFHCGLLVFPLHDENGKIFAYTGIQRDISERKNAEQEKERFISELANKSRELEQVVYATSHDLRTPLVNIDGFSKELEKSVSEITAAMERDDVPSDLKEKFSTISTDEIPEALKYISLSISKMDSLLSGLLKLSRLGRAELTMKELDMNNMLSDVSNIFMALLKKTGTKLEISDLPSCIGDERQVSHIFSNLIDNAIKYLDPDRPCHIRISGKRESGQSIYCVEDNGVGIAAEHQEKIFDLFKQLDPSQHKGEGLGLTIVRKAVERLQGNICLESKSGQGSKFFIALPA